MKKALVVLLAIVMVFAFAATAMAADTQYEPYGDIADQTTDIQSAIERLTILGALKGYNDEGTVYAPGQNITREEFATIGVRIAGLESAVDLYASLASSFTDVEEGRWSEGYINCANANGIMIGRGNGIFDPKADVTMQEVVTVLLRAVGYTDALPGAWPQDYNTKAVNVGLCDYVDFIGPKAATRGEVASMVNEALDLWEVRYVSNDVASGLGYVMDRVDEDGYAYLLSKTNEYSDYKTLLNDTFDAFALDDSAFRDNAFNFGEGNAWEVNDYDEWQLTTYFYNEPEDEYLDFEMADIYGISAGQDITDLAGQYADVTVTYNEDKEMYEVVYVWTTSAVERTDDCGDDPIEAGKYFDPTGVNKGSVVMAPNAYGEIFKDAKGKVYWAKDFSNFEFATFGIVDTVSEKKIETAGGYTINLASKTDNYVFYNLEDGFVEAADIEAGDVLYYYGYIDDAILYLVASPVKGTLDDYSTDTVTLDGTEYDAFFTTNYGYDGVYYYPYDFASVDAIDWPEEVNYVVAYAFKGIAYFADDAKSTAMGIVYRYQYGDGNYLEANYNNEPLTGMEVLLAGDSKVTAIKFAKDFYEAQTLTQAEWPEEGSLVEFKLNEDGEMTGWKATDASVVPAVEINGVGFEGDEDGNYYKAADYNTADYVATFTADSITWNAAGTRATIGSDVYTFASDADIFVVTTFGAPSYADKLNEYAWYNAKDFQAEYGDCDFDVAVVYAANGTEIQTLYVKDIDAAGSEEYVFGLYENVISGSGVTIDGTKYPIAKAAKTAVVADFQAYTAPVLVAVKLTDGEIAAAGDYFFIDDSIASGDGTSIDPIVEEALKAAGYEPADVTFTNDTIDTIVDNVSITVGTETMNIDALNTEFVKGYDVIEDDTFDAVDYLSGLNTALYEGVVDAVTFSNADNDLIYIVMY